MALVFLETSAFLKLYLAERGSAWLKSFISGNQVVLSLLTLAESATILARLYRGGTYTKHEASKLYSQIYQDRFKYDIIRLQPEQPHKVVPLVFNVPIALRLRTLDAIHLVVARRVQTDVSKIAPALPFIFVSSDAQLLKVAQAVGFITENPEDYP